MKRLYFFLSFFLFCFLSARSQVSSSSPSVLETEQKLFIKKTFKVQEDKEMSGRNIFISVPEKLYGPKPSDLFTLVKSDKYPSDLRPIMNKVFECQDVIKSDQAGTFFLKLYNKDTGTLYYPYSIYFTALDTANKRFVTFVGEFICLEGEQYKQNELKQKQNKIKAIADNPCLLIDDITDNVSRTREIRTPEGLEQQGDYGTTTTENFGITYTKNIEKGITRFYAFLTTSSTVPSAFKKGVIILLKNGKRILKPATGVDYNVASDASGYVVSSLIELTPADLALLKASPAVEFKLYVNHGTVHNADTLHKLLLCLISKR